MKKIIVFLMMIWLSGCVELARVKIHERGMDSKPMLLTEEEIQWIKEKNHFVFREGNTDEELKQLYIRVHNTFKWLETEFQNDINQGKADDEGGIYRYIWDWSVGLQFPVKPDGKVFQANNMVVDRVIRQRYTVHAMNKPNGYTRKWLLGDGGGILTLQNQWKAGFVEKFYGKILVRLTPRTRNDVPYKSADYKKLTSENLFGAGFNRQRYSTSIFRTWNAQTADYGCRNRWGSGSYSDGAGGCVKGDRSDKEINVANELGRSMAMEMMGMMRMDIERKTQKLSEMKAESARLTEQQRQQRQREYQQQINNDIQKSISTQNSGDVAATGDADFEPYQAYKERIMRIPAATEYKTDGSFTTVLDMSPAPKMKGSSSSAGSDQGLDGFSVSGSGSGRNAKAACWQSNNGGWFCDGPWQKLWAAEGDLDRAMQMVACDGGTEDRVTSGSGKLEGKRVYVFDCGRPLKEHDYDIESMDYVD